MGAAATVIILIHFLRLPVIKFIAPFVFMHLDDHSHPLKKGTISLSYVSSVLNIDISDSSHSLNAKAETRAALSASIPAG